MTDIDISPEKTTPKQDMFLQAMLSGHTVQASAKIAGCGEKTAYVWLKLPHVQKAYRDAQHAVFAQSLALLMLDMDTARSTLVSVIKDKESPIAVRVRAAQIILENAIKCHTADALEDRILFLEDIIKANTHE